MKSVGKNLCLVICVVATAVAAGGGCAGDRYDRSTGEYIDDKAIAARVRSALGDNFDYKFGDVHVESFRGDVQLSGFVNTGGQKDRAGEIARSVQGVRHVENNVSVKDRIPH